MKSDACEPKILFRDADLIVVDKMSGVSVHRGWARDGPILVELLRPMLGQEVLHPVHRLDRGTSGVVIIALAPDVARVMNDSLSSGAAAKRYLALVRGRPHPR